METPLKVRLHILSPVHIGCDEVYEPTCFLIHENRSVLTEFDPIDFIKTLSKQEKERFTSLCMQGNISSIIGIYKFISGKSMSGREVEIAKELSQHYKKVRDFPVNDEKRIKQELNKFSINRTAYNPYTSLPYIPGSSIKGALRTAYLNALTKKDNIPPFKGKAGDLEKELLKGSFESDPFRMVQVSDFLPIGNIKTKIHYAVNKKKRASKYDARGPFQILEVVLGKAVFEGTVNILDAAKTMGMVKRPVSTKSLYESTHNFYKQMLDMDDFAFKETEVNFSAYKNMPVSFTEKLGKSAFLIRLGRHSGAESMTITGHRSIKIMQDKGNYRHGNYATTLWLASESSKPASNDGLMPFGWALLELEPFDNILLEPIITYQCKSRIDGSGADGNIPALQDSTKVVVDTTPVSTYKEPERILWKNVYLTWHPGNQILKTVHDSKSAEIKIGNDHNFVPEQLHKKLFEKRKGVNANILVEHIGGNAFRIVAFEEQ